MRNNNKRLGMSIGKEFKIWFLREWRFESAHWYQNKYYLLLSLLKTLLEN